MLSKFKKATNSSQKPTSISNNNTIIMAGKRKQDAEASAAEQDNAKEQHDEDALRSKKKQERLEQNRISARESRKRKKTMIEELQRTVITLSKENRELNDRNENLRAQLMELSQKVSRQSTYVSVRHREQIWVFVESLIDS